MNKRQAKDEAYENKRTWGELLELVVSSRTEGMSRLNKGMSKFEAVELFKNAINEKEPESYPRNTPGDVMTVTNILREFA